MKGILLAGGNGNRLAPLTNVVNKHLLPVYDKPMVLYPLETLKRAGLTDILLITGSEHIGRFIEFLGDGSRHGVHLTYRVQERAGGIAEALSLCEHFAAGEDVSVILGDNVFSPKFTPTKTDYGCTVFLRDVGEEEIKRFGCAVTSGDRVVAVEEKPQQPKSTLAMTGYYVFSPKAFERIRSMTPSARGELEITDLINQYVQEGDCGYVTVNGSWADVGTIDSLLEASLAISRETKTL